MRKFNFSEKEVLDYTEGECDILAYALIKLDSCDSYTIYCKNCQTDVHYIVKMNDKFIDIIGIKNEEDLLSYWTSKILCSPKEYCYCTEGCNLTLYSSKHYRISNIPDET